MQSPVTIIVYLTITCSLSSSLDSTLYADLKARGSSRGTLRLSHPEDVPRSRDNQAPEFMVKLYRSVEAGNNQLPAGNTVRCIAGKLMAMSDGSVLILYNISAVAGPVDERILRADIRYFRRKTSPEVLPSSTETADNYTVSSVILLELTPRRFRLLGSHLLMTSSRRGGWVSVDVTSSLRRRSGGRGGRRSRSSSRYRHRSTLLAITFGISASDNDGGRQLSATRRRLTTAELRLLSSPNLVIYSRRTADVAADHVLPILSDYSSPASTWRTSSHRRREQRNKLERRRNRRRKSKRSVSWYSGMDNLLPSDGGETTGLGRYNVPPALPGTARPRQHHHYRHHRHDATGSSVGSTAGEGELGNDEVQLQSSDNRTEGTISATDSADSVEFSDFNESGKFKGRRPPLVCGRRRLIVDVVDIGWNDNVIFPRQFRMDYCAGSCPFPQAEGVKQTNHAAIQSLVHVVGISAGVPAPCCVADTTRPLPMLFYDSGGDVVLTIYQGAVVRSCSCH